MRPSLIIPATIVTAMLGLSACTPVKAQEGSLYRAGEGGAKVTTVQNMTRMRSCPVPKGTIAFGNRETYFEVFQGSAGPDRIPLTQVDHAGPGCSGPSGGYDFIEGDPESKGWKIIEPGTVEWLKAFNELCNAKADNGSEGLRRRCEARK